MCLKLAGYFGYIAAFFPQNAVSGLHEVDFAAPSVSNVRRLAAADGGNTAVRQLNRRGEIWIFEDEGLEIFGNRDVIAAVCQSKRVYGKEGQGA